MDEVEVPQNDARNASNHTPMKKTPKANGKQEEVLAGRLEQARSIMPGWAVKSLLKKSDWPARGKHCPMKEQLKQAAKERNPAVPTFKTSQHYVDWLSRNAPSDGVASSSSKARTVTLISADGEHNLADREQGAFTTEDDGIIYFHLNDTIFCIFLCNDFTVKRQRLTTILPKKIAEIPKIVRIWIFEWRKKTAEKHLSQVNLIPFWGS